MSTPVHWPPCSSAESSLLRTPIPTVVATRTTRAWLIATNSKNSCGSWPPYRCCTSSWMPPTCQSRACHAAHGAQRLIRQVEEPQAFFMVEQGKASCVAVGEGNEISGKATLLTGDCGRQGAVGAQEGLRHRKGRRKARGAQDAARRLRGAGPAQEAEAGEPTRCLQRPALLILLRAIHASHNTRKLPHIDSLLFSI